MPSPASLFLLLAGFFLTLPAAFAQAVSGTIVGTVTDPTGAAVANVPVTIVLSGQDTVHTSVTNESGNFTEPNLPPGTYSVSVTATGFKKETRENIVLETNTTSRVDLALAPGSTTESVTITSAPPQLQTDRADIATTLGEHQIADLPLSSGNSFQSLLNTVPGMAPVVFNNSQFYNANNDLSVNANGQSSYVNLYQIEGIDDDQRTGIHIILVPPAAAIQNVDITTNNFEAEFGRAVGTVVNLTLKSGTNSLPRFGLPEYGEQRGQRAELLRHRTQRTLGLQLHRRLRSADRSSRTSFSFSATSCASPITKSSTFNTNVPVLQRRRRNNLNLSGYSGQVYDPNTGDVDGHLLQGGPTATGGNCGHRAHSLCRATLFRSNNPGISPVAVTVLSGSGCAWRATPRPTWPMPSTSAGTTTNNFSRRTCPSSKDAMEL